MDFKREDFTLKNFRFESNSVLTGLLPDDLAEIDANIKYRHYKKGKTIFTEGAYPAGIFYVKEGLVKKYKNFNDSKEQIIYICNSGELFGYAAVLSEETYPDSASTLVDSQIGFLPKDVFLKILNRSPIFSVKLLKNLSHEYGVMANNIVSFARRNVRERLALVLIVLKDKFKVGNNDMSQMEICLSREDLANTVGTAVETLVRLLHDFKDEGLIAVHGRTIVLLNESALVKAAHLF
jgi:CRP-like cAMP-binding protein